MSIFSKVDELYNVHLHGEVAYLLNELQDTFKPSLDAINITQIVCAMLEDNIAFVAKNGMNNKAKISRDRLLALLNVTELYSSIARENNTFKLLNKNLIIENRQLKKQLADIEKQEKLAKSI